MLAARAKRDPTPGDHAPQCVSPALLSSKRHTTRFLATIDDAFALRDALSRLDVYGVFARRCLVSPVVLLGRTPTAVCGGRKRISEYPPKPEFDEPKTEAQLNDHVQALWKNQVPICIEVFLAPNCNCRLAKVEGLEEQERGLLLERWTMSVCVERADTLSLLTSAQYRWRAVNGCHHRCRDTARDRQLNLFSEPRGDRLKPALKTHRRIGGRHSTCTLRYEGCDGGQNAPVFITSQWLLNAVRSQLHFSQLSAWLARLKNTAAAAEEDSDPNERRRKLSRETCNIKKLEANCDEKDLPITKEDKTQRKLNIVYSIKIPGGSNKLKEFTRPPANHTFPITDIGNNLYLKVVLQSLPRIDDIPVLKCTCTQTDKQFKRRASKDMPQNLHEELTSRMNDLTLGPPDILEDRYRGKGALFSPDLGVINSNIGISSGVTRRLSIFSNPGSSEYLYSRASTPEKQDGDNVDCQTNPSKDRSQIDRPYECSNNKDIVANYLLVDDRMHTPCSESGKHKCNCDDESDNGKENQRSSTSLRVDVKKLDERRLKEIAKYKRRLRKESKLRKLRESGTSESAGASESGGEVKARKEETHTSIPILQASRFDRLRAIGCYRNQTYLTLPASRIEGKSPFMNSDLIPPPTESPKSISVSTQTDEPTCSCGTKMELKCENCIQRGMVRSEANYNLASLNRSDILLEAIRRCDRSTNVDEGAREDEKNVMKHKCDNISNSIKCDIYKNSVVNDSFTSNSSDRDTPVISGVRKYPDDEEDSDRRGGLIKRPKLKRLMPIVDRIEKIVTDRFSVQKETLSPENNDIEELLLKDDDTVFAYMSKSAREEQIKTGRTKNFSISEDYVLYEKSDYGTFDKCDVDSPKETSPVSSEVFRFISPEDRVYKNDLKTESEKRSLLSHDQEGKKVENVPSPSEMDRFRWRFDSAASMVFHTKTGLPLTSSPAPLKRGNNCFDYDDTIRDISGIKSALFHPIPAECVSAGSPPARAGTPPPRAATPRRVPDAGAATRSPKHQPSAALLGSFEESALKGRLEPVATVHGFTAELGASGAFCPPHRRLPVTVFFYAPGGTNAPYMGHINLGPGGYRVARSGTVQVSLLNPHGTLVKMFVVLYDLTNMPAGARTFLRQRTYYMPAGRSSPPAPSVCHKWLRYLIHLRFLTSKSGKLYLHTDIRILVSRKADLDTATAHSAIFKSLSTETTNEIKGENESTNRSKDDSKSTNGKPAHLSSKLESSGDFELGMDVQNGLSYELRSFTYAPENPKYSPR
ncbi:Protein FAM214A [Eumeta japonica]|uniref:Protein FAM214A n=1 Tax=Eumeta variegata TaxID=151549 RepID=A0A4C1Y8J4_EUMVA|nr:Protein FAM214A [Eumeta japonica]